MFTFSVKFYVLGVGLVTRRPLAFIPTLQFYDSMAFLHKAMLPCGFHMMDTSFELSPHMVKSSILQMEVFH